MLITLALSAILFAFFLYIKIEDHYQNRLQRVEGIKGIKLGERFEDVMFRNAGFILDLEKDNKSDAMSYYVNSEKSLRVVFVDNKVIRISYNCLEQNDYTSVNGVTCASSGDNVLDRYEKEILIQCRKDKNDENFLIHRVYDAGKFNVRYHLLSNEVAGFVIAISSGVGKSDGFGSSKWKPCE